MKCIWSAFLLSGSLMLSAATYEILPNGGMEKLENGLPQGWVMLMNQKNMLFTTSDAHRGKYALEIKTGSKVEPDTVITFSGTDSGGRGGYPCVPGAVYRLKATVRSSNYAKIKLYLNLRDGGGGFLGGEMSPVFNTLDEWREYSWPVTVPEGDVRKFGCGIIVLSPDNTVKIDSVSLTYDTEENRGKPDIYRTVKAPQTKIDLQVSGAELLTDGKSSREIGEGLHTLLLLADSGKKCFLKSVRTPELAKRWKIAPGHVVGAEALGFDDSSWTDVEFNPDQSVKFPGTGEFTLRQTVLWNATRHGPWKLFLGTTREYALPEASVDSLYAALYSPLPRGIRNFQLVFDLPAGFRFADMTENPIPNPSLVRPLKVETLPLESGTRVILTYPDQTAEKTNYTLLPLVAPEKIEGSPVLQYFRLGNSNFTELPVEIPVKRLPPIADSGPGLFPIQGYEDSILMPMSKEHAELYFRECAKIGISRLFVSPENMSLSESFLKMLPEGGLVYYEPGGFPMTLKLWGTIFETDRKMLEWLKTHEKAKVRYWKGTPEARYTEDPANGIYYGAFCPSWINGEGKAEFQKKITEVMLAEKKKYPALRHLFIDWEFSPLQNQQQGIWCFCGLCRAEFGRKLGLAKTPSDEEIVSKYAKEWSAFRSGKDAETVRTIASALKKIGISVIYYSQEYVDERWNLKGDVPEIFATLPGNSPATCFRQEFMDRTFAALCKAAGTDSMIAQRFFRLGPSNDRDGWKKITLCSTTGEFQDLELWKMQIMRILATCRGGLDLQCALFYPAGCLYYIGEGVKALRPYEELIRKGKRANALLSSKDLAPNEFIVIRDKKRILVLLFNETEKDRTVSFELFGTGAGKSMTVDGKKKILETNAVTVDIPRMDAKTLLFQ